MRKPLGSSHTDLYVPSRRARHRGGRSDVVSSLCSLVQFLRTSVWSQTWEAFTYEKKLLFDMYPAAVKSGDPAIRPSYHLELADLLFKVDQSIWGCTATDAVACRARIIECMDELELPNWPQTNVRSPSFPFRVKDPSLVNLEGAIAELERLASRVSI